jgi:hypothetical protein
VGTANSTLQNYLAQQQQLYQPYQQTGTNSLAQLQQLTGPGGPLTNQFSAPTAASLTNPNNPATAGYEFTLQQGQQALQRQAAASGSLFSTGTQKSLANYTTGTANQYYNTAYNQALSTFQTNQQQALNQIGSLQSLAGLGSTANTNAANALGTSAQLQSGNTLGGTTAASQLGLSGTEAASGTSLAGATTAGQFGLQGAQIAGQALTNQGNAAAAGTVGSTNAWLNALNGGTNALSQYSAYQNGVYNPYFGGGSLAGATPYGTQTVGNSTAPISGSQLSGASPYTGGYMNAAGNWVATGG